MLESVNRSAGIFRRTEPKRPRARRSAPSCFRRTYSEKIIPKGFCSYRLHLRQIPSSCFRQNNGLAARWTPSPTTVIPLFLSALPSGRDDDGVLPTTTSSATIDFSILAPGPIRVSGIMIESRTTAPGSMEPRENDGGRYFAAYDTAGRHHGIGGSSRLWRYSEAARQDLWRKCASLDRTDEFGSGFSRSMLASHRLSIVPTSRQ